jgi:3'-phosphoadenosine 5'-phosphosulfate (PAPS) 3'-phosphatase
VKAKSDESPLTAADLAANNLICASLKEMYPSIPMCVIFI